MKRIVRVHNKMQTGYEYVCTEPVGKNFAKDFKPDLTPKQMFSLGVFGGVYMRDAKNEYPTSWFARAKLAPVETDGTRKKYHDPELNYFKVNASQPLSVWKAKGWVYKDDPRGWFEWYCRYYMGRRIPDEDERQIKRWRQMTRHIAQIRNHCRVGDESCRRRQRQALLHWAYDSRKL